MDFVTAVKTCLVQKYATFEGTASRSEFWWFFLATWIFSLVVNYLAGNVHPACAILNLAVLIPSLAVGARRLHDIGKSGWLQLLYLIPLLGALILIFAFFIRPGTSVQKAN